LFRSLVLFSFQYYVCCLFSLLLYLYLSIYFALSRVGWYA
jgi:hypothetical protein